MITTVFMIAIASPHHSLSQFGVDHPATNYLRRGDCETMFTFELGW
jgi:hypothetical protein